MQAKEPGAPDWDDALFSGSRLIGQWLGTVVCISMGLLCILIKKAIS